MSVVLTNAICKKEKIQKGSVTLGCDSEGAIKAVSGTRPVTSRWNSYDILARIKQEIRLSTLEWKFKHVYGHQDKKRKKKNLDILPPTKKQRENGHDIRKTVSLPSHITQRLADYGELSSTKKQSPRRFLRDYIITDGYTVQNVSGNADSTLLPTRLI